VFGETKSRTRLAGLQLAFAASLGLVPAHDPV
jgi:hypothetical protein